MSVVKPFIFVASNRTENDFNTIEQGFYFMQIAIFVSPVNNFSFEDSTDPVGVNKHKNKTKIFFFCFLPR